MASFFFVAVGEDWAFSQGQKSSLEALLPRIQSWELVDNPQIFIPETLFEYINGGAESYLSYDFQELIVAHYKKADSEMAITLEIYNMGETKNAFGIYSAERFPGQEFLDLGLQGYLDGDSINFLCGKYYIKMLCFDCGQDPSKTLLHFAQEVAKNIPDWGTFPPVLSLFPREGLVPNGERFVLKNFLGLEFLHDGYVASYKNDSQEWECFYVEGKSEEEASNLLRLYLDFFKKRGETVEELPEGRFRIIHKSERIYLNLAGRYLSGVMRLGEDEEGTGEKYLTFLTESLKEVKRTS